MPQTVNGYTVPAGSDAVSTIDDTMATFAGQLPAQGTIATSSGLNIITPTSTANSGGTVTATGGNIAFSGVTSISLNGIFTSTYANYRVLLVLGSSVNSNPIYLRFRASGTDDSNAVYFWNSVEKPYSAGTGSTGGGAAATTFARITYITNSYKGSAVFDVLNPQVAEYTHADGFTVFGDGGGLTTIQNTVTTQYDGLTVYPNSGNITGTIRVYGYKNS